MASAPQNGGAYGSVGTDGTDECPELPAGQITVPIIASVASLPRPSYAAASSSHAKPEVHSSPSYSTPHRPVKAEHAPSYPHSAPPRRGPTVIDLTASDDDESTTSRYPMPDNGPSVSTSQQQAWQQQDLQRRQQFYQQQQQRQQQQQEALRLQWQQHHAMQQQQNPYLLHQQRQQQMLQYQQMYQGNGVRPQPAPVVPPGLFIPGQESMRPNNLLGSSSQSTVPRYDELSELSALLHGRRRRHTPPDRSDSFGADSDDDLRYMGSQRRYDDFGSLDMYDAVRQVSMFITPL